MKNEISSTYLHYIQSNLYSIISISLTRDNKREKKDKGKKLNHQILTQRKLLYTFRLKVLKRGDGKQTSADHKKGHKMTNVPPGLATRPFRIKFNHYAKRRLTAWLEAPDYFLRV